MKAISINQPWAWAILHGSKDIENRDWSTNYRGKVLIHAGLKFDAAGLEFVERQCGLTIPPADRQRGAILGEVEIVDCVTESDSPWFFGRYGFVLRNPKVIEPRTCKGALGFFTPDYSSRYKTKAGKTRPADLFSTGGPETKAEKFRAFLNKHKDAPYDQ